MVVLDSHNWGPASGGNTIALTLHNAPHWRSWLSAGASDIDVFFGTAITAIAIEVEYSKSCNDNFCDTVGIKVIVPAASDMLNSAQSLRAVEIQMQLQGGQTLTTTGSGAEYTYDALVPTVESVSPSRGSVQGQMYIDLQVRYLLSADAAVANATNAVMASGQTYVQNVQAYGGTSDMASLTNNLRAVDEQAALQVSSSLLSAGVEAKFGSDPRSAWIPSEFADFSGSTGSALGYRGLQDTYTTQLVFVVPAEPNYLADRENGHPGTVEVLVRLAGQTSLCAFNWTYISDTTPRITGLTSLVSAIGGTAPVGSSDRVQSLYADVGKITIQTAYVNANLGASLVARYNGITTTTVVMSNTDIKSQQLELSAEHVPDGATHFSLVSITYDQVTYEEEISVYGLPKISSVSCDGMVCEGVTGRSLEIVLTLERVPAKFLGDCVGEIACAEFDDAVVTFGSQQTVGTVLQMWQENAAQKLRVRSPAFATAGTSQMRINLHNDPRLELSDDVLLFFEVVLPTAPKLIGDHYSSLQAYLQLTPPPVRVSASHLEVTDISQLEILFDGVPANNSQVVSSLSFAPDGSTISFNLQGSPMTDATRVGQSLAVVVRNADLQTARSVSFDVLYVSLPKANIGSRSPAWGTITAAGKNRISLTDL